MPNLKCFTTKEVARLCSVSDATVKRWELSGLLKSERTTGGHRRFRADEVARFRREQGVSVKSAHGDENPLTATRRRRFAGCQKNSELLYSLLSGCEEETSAILIKSYFEGKSLARIFDEIICPAMFQVGELWSEGKIGIAREHIATRIVQSAVHKLRTVLPVTERNGKLAFCCALEGDFHELPTHLTQIILENEGWEVVNFGANTPLHSLKEEVFHYTPDLICISATIFQDSEKIACAYAKFRSQISKLNTPLVLGGKFFGDAPDGKFQAELYAESFSQVVDFVNSSEKQ